MEYTENTTKEFVTNNSIENDYSKLISLDHRKKFAQFFTPFPIADLLAKWLLGNKNLGTVLEPAFGLGIFSRALLNSNENLIIKGFEIDDVIYENAQQHFFDVDNVNLYLKDYIYNDWANKYDGIICNPPYFKFHDYDNKNILQENDAVRANDNESDAPTRKTRRRFHQNSKFQNRRRSEKIRSKFSLKK